MKSFKVTLSVEGFLTWIKNQEISIRTETQNIQGEIRMYDDDYLSVRLQISKRTLKAWRGQGLIEFYQINRKIFYSEETLLLLLKLRKVFYYVKNLRLMLKLRKDSIIS